MERSVPKLRTADQIKRKLHELSAQKQSLTGRLAEAPDEAAGSQLSAMIERLDDQMMLLEWVLNEPVGKYHA